MPTPKIIQKILRPAVDSKLTERAFEFAKVAHRGQKRLSGEDYIQHPIRVAQILKEMRLDSQTIAAGFLHDVPDDTEKTLGDIEKEFGKEIAFLVEGVSKLGRIRYPKDGLEIKPIEARIEEPVDLRAENLRKMFFAMAEDLRVVLIKLADRVSNMETLDSLPPEKQKRIALETLEIFSPLANRLQIGEIKGKLEDLAFPYLYPKEFAWLKSQVKEEYEQREKYLQKIKPILIKILKEGGIKPIDVHSRPKHYWSLYQKLLKHEMDFGRIYDVVALRVIVNDVKTCYAALGVIHKFWRPLPGRIKDYIAFPKPNNYQALHTTCFCLDGKITEIQVKTKKMHEEAEYGIAAHWATKEGINLKTQGKRFAWVQQLRDWQKEVSKSQEFWEGLKIDFFKNRIFVFTPKGDVVDLPEGASPIDFAYAIHTDIGNHCAGAKINGKLSSFSQSLKNGDVVKIITEKNKKPSRDWLEFAKTTLARSRIREQLRKMAGEEMLRAKAAAVKPKPTIPSFSPSAKPSFPPKEKSAQVFLAGERGMKIYLAKCCCPQPGDEIRAWITKERGASIHKTDCENLVQAQKKCPQRIFEASWSGKEKIYYTASLAIKAEDRIGLFRDISSAISALGINILSCHADPPKEKKATLKANVEISDWEDLDKLFGQLKQVKGVLEVRKI